MAHLLWQYFRSVTGNQNSNHLPDLAIGSDGNTGVVLLLNHLPVDAQNLPKIILHSHDAIIYRGVGVV